MKYLHTNQRQKGLTLVELMVAMILSLLLIAGASSMFLGSKKTFKVQEESARIQENVRYIVNRMITDISPAGFHGCAPSAQDGKSQIYSTVESKDGLYDFSHAITGVEGGNANTPDSLTVRFALPELSLPITSPMTKGDTTVQVDSTRPAYSKFEAGDIITVSDCSLIAAFMVTNKPGANGHLEHRSGVSIKGVTNSKAETTHYFGGKSYSSAMAIKMDAVTYDLDKTTSGDAADETTISSLYAKRLGGTRQEILSGVENFQVVYGIDDTDPPDGTSDRYIVWDAVADEKLENRIASLRITLTINSGKPIPGATGISQDSKEDIEFVVKLRNRLADL